MTDDKHREAFERWAKQKKRSLVCNADGDDYLDYLTAYAWNAWQAAMRYRDEKEGKA